MAGRYKAKKCLVGSKALGECMPSILCCGHEVETVNDGVMLKGRHDGCCGLYCQACAKQFIREGWADLMTGTSTSWDTFTGEVPEGVVTSQYRLVEIRWLDAALDADHLPLDAEVRPLERVTVGYLFKEHEDYLEVTFGFIDNLHKGVHACEMKFALPKAMVLSIRDLA